MNNVVRIRKGALPPTGADKVCFDELCLKLWEIKMKQLPLTLDFRRMRQETNLGRTKAFETIKNDEYFPQGIPLSDAERSSKVWWTHRVIAWLIHRDPKSHPECVEDMNNDQSK